MPPNTLTGGGITGDELLNSLSGNPFSPTNLPVDKDSFVLQNTLNTSQFTTLNNELDLKAPLSLVNNKVDKLASPLALNPNLPNVYYTKVQVNQNGLVKDAALATTNDIPDSFDKRYLTEVEKARISRNWDLAASVTPRYSSLLSYSGNETSVLSNVNPTNPVLNDTYLTTNSQGQSLTAGNILTATRRLRFVTGSANTTVGIYHPQNAELKVSYDFRATFRFGFSLQTNNCNCFVGMMGDNSVAPLASMNILTDTTRAKFGVCKTAAGNIGIVSNKVGVTPLIFDTGMPLNPSKVYNLEFIFIKDTDGQPVTQTKLLWSLEDTEIASASTSVTAGRVNGVILDANRPNLNEALARTCYAYSSVSGTTSFELMFANLYL
jgi:hypothetical protein